MHINRCLLLGIILAANSFASYADTFMFNQNSSCPKPSKPFQIDSQWELDSWNNDVSNYQRCILDFVDDQNEQAANHQQAANNAMAEWNRFVNYELN